jgi:hypothetical protein
VQRRIQNANRDGALARDPLPQEREGDEMTTLEDLRKALSWGNDDESDVGERLRPVADEMARHCDEVW